MNDHVPTLFIHRRNDYYSSLKIPPPKLQRSQKASLPTKVSYTSVSQTRPPPHKEAMNQTGPTASVTSLMTHQRVRAPTGPIPDDTEVTRRTPASNPFPSCLQHPPCPPPSYQQLVENGEIAPPGASLQAIDRTTTCSQTKTCSDPPTLVLKDRSIDRTVKGYNTGSSLKVLNINFQSLKNKREEFSALLQLHKPDVIIGTETWLRDHDNNAEYFPSNYDIYRNDRKSESGCSTGHGGVILAIKSNLNSSEIKLPCKCEMSAAKFKMGKKTNVVISSSYRPPNSNTAYAESNIKNFQFLTNINKDAIIICGGDFNLPDVKWNESKIVGNQYNREVNEIYLNGTTEINLEQKVDFSYKIQP